MLPARTCRGSAKRPRVAAALATLLLAATLPGTLYAHGTDAHGNQKLPLGDGRISAAPKAGYLMSCQTRFSPNAPGASAYGDWLQGGYWIPALKPVVPGQVEWPDWRLSIAVEGDRRGVRANNLPKHASGDFPIPRTSEAFRYDRNPNAIRQQDVLLTLPAVPKVAAAPSCVPMGMVGFALTGVAIYNAVDARGEDAPAHEIQDACNAHPQQQGQYHYHNYSPCLTDRAGPTGGHSDLVGYALDGFGFYGLHGEDGRKLTSADLDACHGHSHPVMWDGQMRELYHYHFTEDYPYSIGCFRGAVDPALLRHQGPPGMGASGRDGMGPGTRPGMGPQDRMGPQNGMGRAGFQGPPGGGNRPDLTAAAASLGVSADALRRALGPPPPDFAAAARRLGISEAQLRAALREAMAGR